MSSKTPARGAILPAISFLVPFLVLVPLLSSCASTAPTTGGGPAGAPGSSSAAEQQASRARTELEGQMKALLASENTLGGQPDPQTFALYDFDSRGLSADYRPFGAGLTALLSADLLRVPRVKLVERQKIQVLLRELALSGGADAGAPAGGPAAAAPDPVSQLTGVQERLAKLLPEGSSEPYFTGPADGKVSPELTAAVRKFQAQHGLPADGVPGLKTQTALDNEFQQLPGAAGGQAASSGAAGRAGRILRAAYALSGELLPGEGGHVTAKGHILSTSDGRIVGEVSADAAPSEFQQLANRIAVQVMDRLNIPLKAEERRQILELRPATRNLAAFLAFGRGLQYEDEGLWAGAKTAYSNAVRLDSHFEEARSRASAPGLYGESGSGALAAAPTALASFSGSRRAVTARALGRVGTGVAPAEPRDESGTSRSPDANAPSCPVPVSAPAGGRP